MRKKLQKLAQVKEASFNKSQEVTDKDDIGKNLTPMQALKRKHEGLERDIVGLGHRVDQWEKKITNLKHTKKDNVNLTHKKPKGITEEMIQDQCAVCTIQSS